MASTKVAINTGVSKVKVAAEKVSNLDLLPYSPRNQLAYVAAGTVPYNVMNGNRLKNQLLSMVKMDSKVTPKETANSKPGTLNNVDTRKWYLEQESNIPSLIDKNAPLEQQAKQAFELRNQYRIRARELMSDRETAELLKQTDPNLTWEQIVQRQKDKGLTGDDIYLGIIESSQRSRKSVNRSLGIE